MKIKPKYKLRKLAGETIVFIQGNVETDTSKVMSLNETSVWLWQELENKNFTTDTVSNLLLSQYEIDEATARRDAKEWIEKLSQYNIFE